MAPKDERPVCVEIAAFNEAHPRLSDGGAEGKHPCATPFNIFCVALFFVFCFSRESALGGGSAAAAHGGGEREGRVRWSINSPSKKKCRPSPAGPRIGILIPLPFQSFFPLLLTIFPPALFGNGNRWWEEKKKKVS